MRGRELTALTAAVLLVATTSAATAAQEGGGRFKTCAWQAAVPMVNPAAELNGRDPGAKDMLVSVALPGLGQLRTGKRNWAIAHIAAEAAIWVSFAVFRIQGELRKDDYIEYARVYGGVQNPEGRGQGYYRNLARYRRSDPGPGSFNEREVRELARLLFPDDLDARREYIEQHEIRGGLAWNWESDASWFNYRELRSSSERSFQRSRFCIAAAIANRIASVLGLARSRGPGDTRIDVGLDTLGGDPYPTPTVSVRMRF